MSNPCNNPRKNRKTPIPDSVVIYVALGDVIRQLKRNLSPRSGDIARVVLGHGPQHMFVEGAIIKILSKEKMKLKWGKDFIDHIHRTRKEVKENFVVYLCQNPVSGKRQYLWSKQFEIIERA
jgi:hypothetical protein